MSAYFGVISSDSRKPAIEHCEAISRKFEQIAPDHQSILETEGATFVHARLDTTWESGRDKQPIEFGPSLVLIGDIRLDRREELITQLSLRNDATAEPYSDAQLVTKAWLKWQERLTDHLAGDFSFAIWDANARRLFIARDQFGIATVYFAFHDGKILFSNILNALLWWPGFDRSLNDCVIGETLLFGHNLDQSQTSYLNAQEIRPAHQALIQERKVHQKRYWRIPEGPALRFRNDEAMLGQFREIFDRAIADRFRTSRCTILTSAGMDSTSIAARAKGIAETNDARLMLHTFAEGSTASYSEHQEVLQLGRHLSVPVTVGATSDPLLLTGESFSNNWPCAEFSWFRWRAALDKTFAEIACHSKIGMTGQGGDAILYKGESHFIRNFRGLHFWPILREYYGFRKMHGRRPPLGLKAELKKRFEPERYPGMPLWLNRDLVVAFSLDKKLEAAIDRISGKDLNPNRLRPEAFSQLEAQNWPRIFALHSPNCSGAPLSFRHPFFDLELVNFLLHIPDPKWYFKKQILRQAMVQDLPHFILARPKTVHDFEQGKTSTYTANAMHRLENIKHLHNLEKYLDLKQYGKLLAVADALPPLETQQLDSPIDFANWIEKT